MVFLVESGLAPVAVIFVLFSIMAMVFLVRIGLRGHFALLCPPGAGLGASCALLGLLKHSGPSLGLPGWAFLGAPWGLPALLGLPGPSCALLGPSGASCALLGLPGQP